MESYEGVSLDDTVELPIKPGIPQSVIVRVMEICGVEYKLKDTNMLDNKYPVLYGSRENIENAKKYLKLFTESKLVLRDIARLARRFNTVAKIYTEDDDLKYIMEIVSQNVTNRDKLKILEKVPESNEDCETLDLCGKKIYVYV
ncbi:MAG TPA: hypothetical protein EYG76_01650 [Methanothermococcus okinawensis]|uniref:Uncharacterized protein n=1 Tax=Methanothermococcus okinawensis TaxID=155863 RepID=A0A832YSW4_9EURY|nr:hypothetical protein [Methanothermococcus okinawensis]